MPTLVAGGKSDQEYLLELRDDLKDFPFPQRLTYTGDAAHTYVRVQKWPILEATVPQAPAFSVTVSGVAQTLVGAFSDLGAGQVFVDWDNGFIHFGTTPGVAAPIIVTYNKCRWTNRSMMLKLNDALKVMFPKVRVRNATTFPLVVNKWEYTLPLPDFADPRTRITRFEVQQIPAATEQFWVQRPWIRVSPNMIRLPSSQWFAPGSLARIHYEAPYRSVAELDMGVQHLPKMYAKAMLLLDEEAKRARFDLAPVSQEEQLNPPGNSAQLGNALLSEFRQELADLRIPLRMAAIQYSYDR